MPVIRVTVACLICVAGSTLSFAQDAQPATSDTKPVKEHKICHHDVDTGSMMSHPICHTKEEWTAIAAQNQQQIDQATAHRTGGGTGH